MASGTIRSQISHFSLPDYIKAVGHDFSSFITFLAIMPLPNVRKRKQLSLEDRMTVIKHSEGGMTAIAISDLVGCGKTQIQNIIKKTDEIKALWNSGEGRASQKFVSKVRKVTHDKIDEMVWEWFRKARSKNLLITGKMIQEEALLLSLKLSYDDFLASNGWLHRWQQRHHVKMAVISGEAADVNPTTVDDWHKRLPDICAGYTNKDIFNADETGLFFRALSTSSMVAKGDDCKGGHIDKDRITVLLCCSATGEKLQPLVIGRSLNPRCFRGRASPVPVIYKANRKAMMTSDMFTTWLHLVNNKMKIQDRKILLLLDNCSAHPDLDLSHVKLVYLPPRTTSHLQPLDAGIIQAVKMVYRKKLLRHFVLLMDDANCASDLAKCVKVLDAIVWLRHAWDCLREKTIVKCFSKCGVTTSIETSDTTDFDADALDDESQAVLGYTTLAEYVNLDSDLATTETIDPNWRDNLLAKAAGDIASDTLSEEEDGEEATDPAGPAVPSANQLAGYFREGVAFSLEHDNPELFDLMTKATSLIEQQKWQSIKSAQQTSIKDFIRPTCSSVSNF